MNYGRQVGVRASNTQSTEQAPTMTVTNVSRIELALVEYGDERGIKHTDLAFIAGNRAFTAPRGEEWTAGFRSFVKSIADQIVEKHAALAPRTQPSGQVPQQDAVDVVGGEGFTSTQPETETAP